MTLQIELYVRKPQEPIEGVKVTAENMQELAAWCHGEVHTIKSNKKNGIDEQHIKVNVLNPRNERQTKAFIDDMVLKVGYSIKIYMPIPFANGFTKLDKSKKIQTSPVVESDSNKELLVELFTTTNNLVDLNTWKPGEDVDSDALVKAEVKSYRRDLADLFNKSAH